jgi:hypothetical protein
MSQNNGNNNNQNNRRKKGTNANTAKDNISVKRDKRIKKFPCVIKFITPQKWPPSNSSTTWNCGDN